MTEDEFIELSWRAHVGGLADRINLTMARLRLTGDNSLRQIVLAFSGITSAGMHMSRVMDRALRDAPVYIPSSLYENGEELGMDMSKYQAIVPLELNYSDMEDRVIAMCAKSMRSEDFPIHFLDPAKLDYRPFNLDFKHHNKVAIGRMRSYRGPPPRRHK